MKKPLIGFTGQLPVLGPDERDENRDDFRNVPRSDRGNRGYGDRGMLGTFQTRDTQWPNPKGVQAASGGYDPSIERNVHGYGVEDADVVRGFCEPGITENPAYDKVNYCERSTVPRHPDEDFGNADRMERDWEFRGRNRESRGFLTRPRIPTERG